VPELQAARGASLIASETSGEPTTGASSGEGRRPRRLPAPALAFTVAALALTLDQVTKQIAVRELTGHDPVPLLGTFLQLRLVLNPGAAFSAGSSLTPLISVVAVGATVAVVFYALRVRHRVWALALGLLLAGVTGNLMDRLFRPPAPFRGHVVDFFALPNWPVFNVADICIDVAGVLFVILLLRGIHLDGSRHEEPARDET
jgi:signal peptidase II